MAILASKKNLDLIRLGKRQCFPQNRADSFLSSHIATFDLLPVFHDMPLDDDLAGAILQF
jgi:hypothetical protein